MTKPNLDGLIKDWPGAAKIINQAGNNLRNRYGELSLETHQIDQEIQRISEYNPHSVLPSDYCYNLINKSPISFKHCFFEWLERGKYRYLGPDYRYSSSIYWKGEIVGEWKNGRPELRVDPRD